MSDVAKLAAIWIKRAHRQPMEPVDHARLVAGSGLTGNADYGAQRQITIIEREVFAELPAPIRDSVQPSARRANLMVTGIRLKDTSGSILRVGPCRILIRGETKPCHRMDQACPGLQQALRPNWGGGAWGDVLDDGEIRVGDGVAWAD